MITNNTINQAFKGSWIIGKKTVEGKPEKDAFVNTALAGINLRSAKLLPSDIATLKTAIVVSTGNRELTKDLDNILEDGTIIKTSKGYEIRLAGESTPVIQFIA